jgi:Tfp pilus assembly protein PilN
MKPATPSLRNGARTNGGAVAALHQQEGRWRLLIARRRERWEVVEARTLHSLDAVTLRPLLQEQEVSRVVRVAPGRETVARCVTVPAGDDAALTGAASLMAEVELPSMLPPHRRCGGVLPYGGAAKTALLTGWMPGSQPPAPLGLEDVEEAWIAPLAALAILRGEAGGSAAYGEPSEGLICVLVPGAERTVARVLVEEPGATWRSAFERAATEAAQLASVENSLSLQGETRRVFLETNAETDLRARIAGIPQIESWLDEYGIALGAALAAGSELASVRSLASLHAEPPRPRLTRVQRATRCLAQPRNAWIVVAASVALMLLGPMGLAYGRAVLLESRAEKLRALKVGREGLEKKAAMYEQLEKNRWPMTKLMADISTAAPIGVTISSLTINVGQPVMVKGTADSAEALAKFQSNLNATRVLGNVSVTRQVAKGAGYDFDLSARVLSNPHVPVKLTEENDFAKSPLAERLYGEGASNTFATSGSGENSSRSRRRPEAARSSDEGARTASASRRPTDTAADPVPPPLTDEAIAKMDRNTAMKEWSQRKKALSTIKTLDAATRQRLTEEVDKTKAQMDKLRDAPGGGA